MDSTFIASPELTKDLEEKTKNLAQSNKPKIIAGKFKEITDINNKQLKHFKSASKFGKYLWKQDIHILKDEYEGMHMGLLMDDTIHYVHIVFVSPKVLNFILNDCKDNGVETLK